MEAEELITNESEEFEGIKYEFEELTPDIFVEMQIWGHGPAVGYFLKGKQQVWASFLFLGYSYSIAPKDRTISALKEAMLNEIVRVIGYRKS